MSRILKVYHFQLKGARVASNVISFPSYPGSLSSLDDFYLMERFIFLSAVVTFRLWEGKREKEKEKEREIEKRNFV
jgi:hypothetical protein